MNLLLFAGAGVSVELGVPAMRRMVLDLHAHLKNQNLPSDIFSRFEHMLPNTDYDIEKLIEAVEGMESGENQKKSLGLGVNQELLDTMRIMRWETEWFIQHVCERIRESEARALWGPTFRRIGNHSVCFVTTNYDRSIEIGGRFSGNYIDDGFAEFNSNEYSLWSGVNVESPIKLLKIHGSTDWYQGEDNLVFKLKHPMPLYGDLFVSSSSGDIPKIRSAIVLPTMEKRINQPPYPDLVTNFRNAARHADLTIFLGTSLRDPDIFDIFRQCSERIPTYLVDIKHENVNLPENKKAKVILQTASKFIISTLPRLLDSSDPNFLDEIKTNENDIKASVLPWLVAIEDETLGPNEICLSIENLADNDVAIDFYTLKALLTHSDSIVRKYAIALIPASLDQNEAMTVAEELKIKKPDDSYADELDMLSKLLEQAV